jgi:hypothetical protein
MNVNPDNQPIEEPITHKQEVQRQLGLLKGQFTIPDNFLDEDPDIAAMFNDDVSCP